MNNQFKKHGLIVLIFTLITLTQAKAQTVEVTYYEDGKERHEFIDIPVSLTYPVDSLLSDWQARNYVVRYNSDDCNTSEVNPTFTDAVIMDRLSRIPAVMEMPYNEVVRRFIDLYTGRLRKQVSFMLSASNFYIPIFEEALDAYGLPIELKYLPIIESALNPSAVSRAGASGLWQFMIGTGKIYGLESNSLVDDRRDPIKATWAAARYLKELYNIYGDWNLVIAAYNCGPGNVNKAIRRANGKRDYWAIYEFLPRETRGYVPSFIAANYVMRYYCDHNICPMETRIPADTDTLQITRNLHFEQIAALCDIEIDQIKSLNPQYKKGIIPGNIKPYTLRLPLNQICTFLENQDSVYSYRADALFSNRQQVEIKQTTSTASKGGGGTAGSGKLTYHKIRSGESLSTIAGKYRVKVNDIKKWNNLRNNNIVAGKSLKIYR